MMQRFVNQSENHVFLTAAQPSLSKTRVVQQGTSGTWWTACSWCAHSHARWRARHRLRHVHIDTQEDQRLIGPRVEAKAADAGMAAPHGAAHGAVFPSGGRMLVLLWASSRMDDGRMLTAPCVLSRRHTTRPNMPPLPRGAHLHGLPSPPAVHPPPRHHTPPRLGRVDWPGEGVSVCEGYGCPYGRPR